MLPLSIFDCSWHRREVRLSDTYADALQMGEVHLLVLHSHHADRHHLLDILPPPLHLLPIQVCMDTGNPVTQIIMICSLLRTALLVTVFLLLINIFSGIQFSIKKNVFMNILIIFHQSLEMIAD